MNSVRGRRPGGPDTRGQVLDTARAMFVERGYRATTVRAVAERAAVDPALVSYYFGSKRGLFGAAMTLPVNPADVLGAVIDAGDLADLPARLLTAVVSTWDDPETGPALRELVIMAMQDPTVLRALREFMEREVVGRLAERLGGADASARAAAGATQVAGIILARYVLRLDTVAAMPARELVARLTPALTTLLAPHPAARRPRR